jgi:hypothetical protein
MCCVQARAAKVSASAAAVLAAESDSQVQHTGVQIIIIGTKYDLLSGMSLQLRSMLAKGLRCLAHAHGAHLLYMGQAKSSTARHEASSEDKDQMLYMHRSMRTLLTHALFFGFEKRSYAMANHTATHVPLCPSAGSAPRDHTEARHLYAGRWKQ